MSRILITTAEAVRRAGGSKRKLARALGITPPAISYYGRYLPDERARQALALWPDIAHREGR